MTAIERIIHVWRAAKQVGKKQAVEQLPADKPARGTDKKDVPGRPLPIAADDQGGASANSVSTGLPPLTGSMRHD